MTQPFLCSSQRVFLVCKCAVFFLFIYWQRSYSRCHCVVFCVFVHRSASFRAYPVDGFEGLSSNRIGSSDSVMVRGPVSYVHLVVVDHSPGLFLIVSLLRRLPILHLPTHLLNGRMHSMYTQMHSFRSSLHFILRNFSSFLLFWKTNGSVSFWGIPSILLGMYHHYSSA